MCSLKKSFFKKLGVTAAAVLFFFVPGVLAHQPRLVFDETDIRVTLPEISKAYYGTLAGKPANYRIEAKDAFRLYVNILVPYIEGIEKDISVTIRKQGTVISRLDGSAHDWKVFHEPFAGDEYYRGPEYVEMQDAGVYEIQVSSPGNQGKYVLAIGDREAFPFGELVKTYRVLPRLKSEFFGKSPFSAFSNIMGIFLGIIILIVLVIAAAFYFGIKMIKKKYLIKIESDMNTYSN